MTMKKANLTKVLVSAALAALVGCAGDADVLETKGDTSPTVAAALSQFNGRACATPNVSALEQELVDVEMKAGGNRPPGGGGTLPEVAEQIDVYFHVIRRLTDGAGAVSDQMINDQIASLNAAYAPSGFSFRLVGQDQTFDNDYFKAVPGSAAETAMKNELRKGTARTLNLYTGVNDGSLLGWATFPNNYNSAPKKDGVVILFATLPGGGAGGASADEPDGVLTYDGGATTIHEVGHWLGLYHTFQGGCDARQNDLVTDTEIERTPQYYCVERDSCTGPKFPGSDPIHNFMDYVDDLCMDHFTDGQDTRMRQVYAAYRYNK